jgi:RimJ/RimL family protein N-acetyltransferase
MTQSIPIAGLVIRRWREQDAEALHRAVTASVEHLRPWLPWIALEPRTVEQRRALIRDWAAGRGPDGDLVFGMFLEDEVVGGCGLHRRIGPDALEIGYWVHVAHLRKGFATAGAAAMTRLAFDFPEVRRVEIHHDRANAASAGVPRTLGFTRGEERPNVVQAPAETGIHVVWTIQREQWAGSSWAAAARSTG